MSKKKLIGILVLFAALLAVYLPKLICPINQLDGPWFFSQAPSFLQGGGMFNFYTNCFTPAFYGLLQIPYATSLTPILGVHLFYLTFAIVLALFLIYKLRNNVLYLSLPLLLILDKTMLVERPEPVVLLLTLILYHIWTRHLKKNMFWGIALGLLLISLHVPPGILAVASVLCYERLLFKPTKIYFILGFLGIASITAFCTLLPENLFASTLVGRLSNFSISLPLKFLSFSGITLATLLYLIRKELTSEFLMNYLVVILGALALGAYYYLVFLLLAPILILIENPMPRPNIKWIAVPVLFNVLLNIIHPMYTSLENKEYCIQANAIIKITAQVETDLLKQEQPKKYFIENNIGPASVTQGNNCRMLLFEPTRMIIFDSVAVGDKIAITTTKKLNQFLGHQKERNTVDFEIDKVREPVKGKLSIKSLYRQRTDSLGLWMLTAKEI